MLKKSLNAAACVLLLSSVSAFAMTDAEFGVSLQPAFHMAVDGRYKLAEKKAKQTLDLLKDLRNYADELNGRADKLRKEMLGNHYDDMVNTELLPSIFDAKASYETIKTTYDLEKDNVGSGLKAAKAGDYSGIDATVARLSAFESDNEPRVKAIDAKVAGVNQAYGHHFGNAKNALAQFNALPLIAQLLAAKPKLVKKIELVPASLRPLQWSIRLQKQEKDSNDPRFSQVPRSVRNPDGGDYPVVVR